MCRMWLPSIFTLDQQLPNLSLCSTYQRKPQTFQMWQHHQNHQTKQQKLRCCNRLTALSQQSKCTTPWFSTESHGTGQLMHSSPHSSSSSPPSATRRHPTPEKNKNQRKRGGCHVCVHKRSPGNTSPLSWSLAPSS